MDKDNQDEIDQYILMLLVYGMLEGFELDISMGSPLIEQGYTDNLEAFDEVLFPDEFY